MSPSSLLFLVDHGFDLNYLVRAGIPVFSPIAHSHGIAFAGNIDAANHAIWLPADAPFMAAARGLIVCRMDGWQESFGIAEEIRVFLAAGKPVVWMNPGEVPALELPPCEV